MNKVLILGGAGFIGSNIARLFVKNKFRVTIIDGFLKNTGANIENIKSIFKDITLINHRIEEVSDINDIIDNCDLIIDSMGWTSHLEALENPFYDLELNCYSHLFLLNKLKNFTGKRVIYLSSRGVYGNPSKKIIKENLCTKPLDVQGNHKLCSENYFRIYSNLYQINAIILRLPNCFGPNQPVEGNDIGLIGEFIKKSLQNGTIEIYGKKRWRNILYVNDLVHIIKKISFLNWEGFKIFNVSGLEISIYDLAKTIVTIIKKGEIKLKEMPFKIGSIDIGSSKIDDNALRNAIGEYQNTDVQISLENTIKYFIERVNVDDKAL